MSDQKPDCVLSDDEHELSTPTRNARASVSRSGSGGGIGGANTLVDDNSPPTPKSPTRNMNVFRLLLVALLLVALAGTTVAVLLGDKSRGKNYAKKRSAQCIGDSVLSAMNRSADPCGNFYEYACGSWMRKNAIPPDRIQNARSFSGVSDNVRKELRVLLEEDLQDPQHPNAIAGRFYAACIKGMAIGPLDVRILARFRPIFDNLKNAQSFSDALAALHGASSAGMFDTNIGVDDKHPDRYALFFRQGGLGLFHPDKYTSEKPDDVKVRTSYTQLIEGHLRVCVRGKLIKSQNIEELAQKTFEFEKSLASIQKPPEELRDPTKLYNPMILEAFPEEIFIHLYLEKIGIDKNKINSTVIVTDPNYLQGIGNMMARVSGNSDYREAVKGYLGFHLVGHFATLGVMGEELYNDSFEFRKTISGVKVMPQKWKRCLGLTSNFAGDALGEGFVKRHFPDSTKQVAEQLTKDITSAFGESISHQEWMDSTTRSRAQEKLKAMNWKLGYTTKFDEYRGLVIGKHKPDFAENILNSTAYAVRYSIGRLGKPIDKTQWFMNAYDTNAYYDSSRNEMAFPAGILQQPFFSEVYPDAMNYGGIGAVIGHEMSHGFDDGGRKYDKDGRLTPWWSEASAKTYEDKAKCFVDLFNGYKPRSASTYVKGNLTLGENLADTNGVKVSFQAFKGVGGNSKNSDPNARAPNPVLAAVMTNHQLFFVAYAQMWCVNYRPKLLEVKLLTDPHSPAQFRVRGPLSQTEEFASTFKCKPGSTYNPEKRCSLW